MSYVCSVCGERHSDLPLCFGSEAPWRGLINDPSEFEARVELNDDLCVVDKKYFFIRGHIELPIRGTEKSFAWSVWSSLSESSFRAINETWNETGRENQEPYFGWLSTSIACYAENTINLKLSVQNQPVGQVPQFFVRSEDHQLFAEQSEGIEWSRVEEICHELLQNGI